MNLVNIFTIFLIPVFTSGTNQTSNHNFDYALAEIRCNTTTNVYKVNYLWTLDHFDFHEANEKTIFSPEFSAIGNDKFKWCLKLYPNTKYFTDDASATSIGIYLRFNSYCEDKEVIASYRFSTLDDEQNEMWSSPLEVKRFYDSLSEGVGRGYDIPKEKVILPNKKLKICCNVTFLPVNTTLHHQYDVILPRQLNISEWNLPKNLALLYKNKSFADVILSVNGKKYPAHKNILASCSAVFASMFDINGKKGKIRRITITDMSEEVLDEMLRYIYTGKCENLEKLAEGLLMASDKYGVDGLKTICADTLCKTLSVENAPNTLILADKCGATELKSRTIEFIAAKYTEVSNTTAWKNIVKENLQFVHEIHQDICHRLSSGKFHNDKMTKKFCS